MKSLPITCALVLTALSPAARAQTADCDFASGLVDFFVNVRFEDFVDCPSGSGIPCQQDPHEQDLVGWGVVLAAGPGTAGDSGITNGSGNSAWVGNGGLTNTCIRHGTHQVTLSLPSPNPYDPEASWPTNLSYTVTINPTNAAGQQVDRFFLSIYLGCNCASDGSVCTDDNCLNGLCAYTAVAYDPSLPELCNDKDDDCDGDVDEGLPTSAPECSDPREIGCADGTREGFMTWEDFPLIASCGGAWTVPGVDGPATCSRAAGNHGTSVNGSGCSAADLCPAGWHVCYGPEDVAQRLGSGDCGDAVDPFYPNFGSGAVAPEVSVPPGGAFFASAARSSGPSCEEGVNEGAGVGSMAGVYGCGNMGGALAADSCGFFDRIGGALCGGLRNEEPTVADDPATDYGYAQSSEWAWSCGTSAGAELGALKKTLRDRQGGVLCCKDSDPVLAEVCDGIDNDADGLTDEVAFGGGQVIEGGDVCQSNGQCGELVCTPDGGWVCIDLRACDDTSCNGIDDDGDGATDDDFPVTPTSCGLGVCAASGQTTCVGGVEGDSCAPGGKDEASDLTCDGQDGDCDGTTDEDFPAAASSCGVGACAAVGVQSCVAGEVRDTCTPGEPLAATDATCDAIDGDCDGEDDEEVAAVPTTCGVGACAATGSESCVGGVLVDSCTPGGATGTDETCDGADDDCDGTTDEDFIAAATTCGVGACAENTGVRTCEDGVAGDSCDPLAGAVTETCDGTDDDCDGETDEGFGVGTACDGDDDDACERGTVACGEGGVAVCEESGAAEVEVCDGEDNDCDEEIDEDVEGCADRDEDTVPDALDNCVDIPNTDQEDSDGDGAGDACDVIAQGGACQGGGLGLGGALVGLGLATVLVRRRAQRS